MGQRAPSVTQILVAVAFAFSCFGLLLFLWNAFGGPVPFAPQGYRVKVPFNEASQLAVESDVRISSVSVGKVKAIELEDEGENRDLAVATLEIDEDYAPIPTDTLAMLRAKTLLGETYVELTPGDGEGPTLPEGDSLPPAQVAESVQLDEIFRTFDEPTRIAFQTWMQEAAIATAGRGQDLSSAIANLEPLAEDANKLLRVLDTQEQTLSQFVRNTGVVFGALSERQGQLRGLIENSGAVFRTTAQRNEDLEATFRALPTFLDESRLTLNRLETFSNETNPLITQLRPAARELSGVLRQTARAAPDFKGFFVGFRKLAVRARTGLPALRAILDTDLPPVLTQFSDFLRQVTPIIATATRYKREITGFLGNITGATQATVAQTETGDLPAHYVRVSNPLTPEAFAFWDNRLEMNRSAAFRIPGWGDLIGSLPSFETAQCAGGANGTMDPSTPTDPDFIPRANLALGSTPEDLFERIQEFAFGGGLSTTETPRPPCIQQPSVASIGEVPEVTRYQHVYQDPP
ncbi:MAG: virulence factor Mce family protein [Solirubrobacterales bacterium]|nr:virulence factor Mce family protein [Solirubrobacterales bacterium]